MLPLSSLRAIVVLILVGSLDFGFAFSVPSSPAFQGKTAMASRGGAATKASSATTTTTTTSLNSNSNNVRGGGEETSNDRNVSVFLASLWGSGGVIYILAKAIKRVLPIAMEPFAKGAVPLSQLELG